MSAEPPRIFISYRTDDSAGSTGRLGDLLVRHLGKDRVFMDVGSMYAGENLRSEIEQALDECDVLLAVIGKSWPSEPLKKEDDFVRLEIRTALDRGVLVIPVLVEQGSMPTVKELPEDLAPLTGLLAATISHHSFESDVNRLLESIEAHFRPEEESPDSETAEAPPRRRAFDPVLTFVVLVVVGVLGYVVWEATRKTTPPYIAAFVYPPQPKGQRIQIQPSFLSDFEHRSNTITLYVFVHKGETGFTGEQNKQKWSDEIKAIKRRLQPMMTGPRFSEADPERVLEDAQFEVVGTSTDPDPMSESELSGTIEEWEGTNVELLLIKGAP